MLFRSRVRTRLFRLGLPQSATRGVSGTIPSTSPDVFPRCENVVVKGQPYGYIRIATFDVPDDQAFVEEFIRLVAQLSARGLIIDVRGNGGGLVLAGERLLQCLTPRRIDPAGSLDREEVDPDHWSPGRRMANPTTTPACGATSWR